MRKEVHLDESVVEQLERLAQSMRPPVKVKKLMEQILSEHATGRRDDNDQGGGVTVPAHDFSADLREPGIEPSSLAIQIMRSDAKRTIKLLKLESRLANTLSSKRYEETVRYAVEVDSETKSNIVSQVKSRFGTLTSVLTGVGQMVENLTIRMNDTHVFLAEDDGIEYMISYEYK